MRVENLDYDDLSEEDQRCVPDNGSGKEMAAYMRITYADGGDSHIESDAMEPEDATFRHDLSWIGVAIKRAYRQGLKDADKQV